jgi:hypothetical protein
MQDLEHTSKGILLKAGSNRFLHWLWNIMVKMGKATMNGVELNASLQYCRIFATSVVPVSDDITPNEMGPWIRNNPMRVKCSIMSAAMICPCTCGQNPPALSYGAS